VLAWPWRPTVTRIDTDAGPSIGRHVPFTSHTDARTVRTRNGEYLRSWQIRGIAFETMEPAEVATRHETLNQLVRALGNGDLAFWTHKIRCAVHPVVTGDYGNCFASALADQYAKKLDATGMLANQLFLTIVYRAAKQGRGQLRPGLAGPTLDSLIACEERALARLDEVSLQVESTLANYGPVALTTYVSGHTVNSRILELFGMILNGRWERVPVPNGPIHEGLATVRLLFGAERIEIRGSNFTRYSAILDLKDYPEWSEPGVLNSLLYGDCEFVETQSFSCLEPIEARNYLQRQRNHLLTANDGARSQVSALDGALDQLVGGAFVFGEFHYSLAILGSSLDEVSRGLAQARVALLEQGFQSAVIDLVSEAAWFAQLPGNWRFRPRLARLSSRNFCGMSPLHNFATGKSEGNPWGAAVCLLKGPHGGPFYFNFHASEEGCDNFDQKLPGNTMIIGQTGSGKTVTELFFVSQALKFGPRIVIVDKDRGAEIAVRALGGRYVVLRSGSPTGLNPFHLEPSGRTVSFWEALLRKLLEMSGVFPNPLEAAGIAHAIRTVATFPRAKRSLTTIRQNLVGANTERVFLALGRWCEPGPLAWVLDNPTHELDFETGTVIGIDYTELLENAEARTPIVMLLLHLIEAALDGRRFIYVLAEFWKALDDPVFEDFVRNKQKTIRKQNGIGIFDTQSPVDVLASPIARTVVEQTATLIFLPNPRADRDDYVNGFKLSDVEFEIIRSLGESSRMFLVKQNGRSSVAELDLSGIASALDVLSASTDNLQIFDELREQVGEHPEKWLPLLHARLAERRNSNRSKGRG
jgi:type IV secretion system protein VirB4